MSHSLSPTTVFSEQFVAREGFQLQILAKKQLSPILDCFVSHMCLPLCSYYSQRAFANDFSVITTKERCVESQCTIKIEQAVLEVRCQLRMNLEPWPVIGAQRAPYYTLTATEIVQHHADASKTLTIHGWRERSTIGQEQALIDNEQIREELTLCCTPEQYFKRWNVVLGYKVDLPGCN